MLQCLVASPFAAVHRDREDLRLPRCPSDRGAEEGDKPGHDSTHGPDEVHEIARGTDQDGSTDSGDDRNGEHGDHGDRLPRSRELVTHFGQTHSPRHAGQESECPTTNRRGDHQPICCREHREVHEGHGHEKDRHEKDRHDHGDDSRAASLIRRIAPPLYLRPGDGHSFGSFIFANDIPDRDVGLPGLRRSRNMRGRPQDAPFLIVDGTERVQRPPATRAWRSLPAQSLGEWLPTPVRAIRPVVNDAHLRLHRR